MIQTRRHDQNGKVMLAHTLDSYNALERFLEHVHLWQDDTVLLQHRIPQKLNKLPSFSTSLLAQMTIHGSHTAGVAQRRTIRRDSATVPWLYRNQAIRQAKALQKRFYDKKVRDLRTCDSIAGDIQSHFWFLVDDTITDGDMQAAARIIISTSLWSKRLKPLGDNLSGHHVSANMNDWNSVNQQMTCSASTSL